MCCYVHTCSTVGDIHEELEIMVYKMGSRNSEQLLGKVKMPLHRVCMCELSSCVLMAP